jgi:transcriptional regulator with XRE-family HTH domain
MIGLSDLGKRIATARKEKQLSQIHLAHKSGVSRSTIDLLENGRAREIGFSKLTRILAAVGLEFSLQPTARHRPTLDVLLKESSND